MNRRWMVVAAAALVATTWIQMGCGDDFRGPGADLAEEADVDLDEQDELGAFDEEGDRRVVLGEVEDAEVTATFEGEAGQWYHVEIYSLGLPEPRVGILSEENHLYRRFTPMTEDYYAEREFVLAEPGEHHLEISSGQVGTPDRGDTWQFVMAVEQIAPPEPKQIIPDAVHILDAGDIAGNVIELQVPDVDGELRVYKDDLGKSGSNVYAQPLVTFGVHDDVKNWRPIGIDVEDHDGSIPLLVDFAGLKSPDDTFGALVDFAVEIPAEDSVEETVDVDAGHILAVLHRDHASVVDTEIVDESGDAVSVLEVPEEPTIYAPVVLHYSEEGGEYTTRFINDGAHSRQGASWHTAVLEPESLGEAQVGEDLEVVHSDDLAGNEASHLQFDVQEDAVGEFYADADADDVVNFQLLRRDDETNDVVGEFSSHSTAGHEIVLPAGSYDVIAQATRRGVEDGFEFSGDFVSEPYVYEKDEQFALERGDMVVIETEGTFEDPMTVTASRDGELVFGPEMMKPDSERIWFYAETDGEYEVAVESGPLLEAPSLARWDFDALSPEDLGAIDEQTAAMTRALDDTDLFMHRNFTFEAQQSVYVAYSAQHEDGSPASMESRLLEVDDDVAPVSMVSTLGRTFSGTIDAGEYLIENFGGTNEREMVLDMLPAPETFASSDTGAVPVDGTDFVGEAEVNDCGELDRVAVDVAFSASGLGIALEAPSGDEVLLNEPSDCCPTSRHVIFPDDQSPDEDMGSLDDASADGTWTLTAWDDAGDEQQTIDEWTLKLWCE